MQVDGFFLRRCKQGTVQFVLLKPVMAALVLIMYAGGVYTDGDMSPSNGYVSYAQSQPAKQLLASMHGMAQAVYDGHACCDKQQHRE